MFDLLQATHRDGLHEHNGFDEPRLWEGDSADNMQLDSTLGSVIQTLASKSVHRIYAVAGENNEIVGVITLRDVISCFIYEPPNHFDNYFGFALQEMLDQ